MTLIPTAILLTVVLISCETVLKVTGKDFVDVLKLKLRKNNDDYDELLLDNNTSTTTPSNQENVTEPDVMLFNKKHPTLGVLDLRRSFMEPKHVKQDISPARLDLNLSVSKSLPDTTISTNTAENVTRAFFRSENKLNFNKEKMEKFKKFMNKNKNLFSELLSKKKTLQTVHVPTLANQATPTPVTTPTMMTPPSTTPVVTVVSITMRQRFPLKRQTSFLRSKLSKKVDDNSMETNTRFRVFTEGYRNPSVVTPREEQLDMAPAKGSKIHLMRLKGRLCQRNVMLPEGPKYDSKGKMYLGGYTNKYGRDYSHTRRPKMVLPRCCNCCKKSVLGCE